MIDTLDLALAATLGFALGMLYQEVHFRKITRALDEATKHLDALEARIAEEPRHG